MKPKIKKRRISEEQELLQAFVIKCCITRAAEALIENGGVLATVAEVYYKAEGFAKEWDALDVIQEQLSDTIQFTTMDSKLELTKLKKDGVPRKALIT